MIGRFGRVVLALCVLALAACSPEEGQTPEEFYRGKTITLLIGSSAGGAYDVYARMLARHMGKHIPGNPRIVPSNMEGAGSLTLTNHLYNVARKDGTVIGTINRGAPFEPLIGEPELARFDPALFTWIGSIANEVSICAVWERAGDGQFRAAVHARADGGRHGERRRHEPIPEGDERRARNQNEDRQRLSRRQQYRSRHGARRSGWALRLVVVERRIDAQGVARLRLDQGAGAAGVAEASRLCRTCR